MIREKHDQPSPTIVRKSSGFGLDIQVRRQVNAKVDLYDSGVPDGMNEGAEGHTDYPRREVIPPAPIGDGTVETPRDPQRPGKQYVDTVASYANEQNDPTLHGPMEAMRTADRGIALRGYDDFRPRTAPMPRAQQDNQYLDGYGKNSADPRMTEQDSSTMILPKERPDRMDLFTDEIRDGFPKKANG